MIRVSVDASAVPPSPTGAGRYVVELVAALGRRNDVAASVVTRRSDASRWHPGPAGAVLAAAPTARPLRLAWEQVRLPSLLRHANADVHHAPHYTMPERWRGPTVVTIHDLTFLDHPEWHEPVQRRFFARAARVAAARASALVCVSEATAARVRELLRPRAEVHVVPHGVDHERYRPQPAITAAGRSYVGFVGTLEPRKDVPTLVAAFNRIAAARPDLELRIAGRDGWGRGAVDAAIAASPYAARIERLGYLPEAAIPAFLSGAAVIAYPSLAEGFGLPALEAMACGAPLVTTRGSAMEEVAGGAALLVPPGDAGALADAIAAVIDDPASAQRRRAAGLQTAARYTWDACAAGHADVYRAALAAARR